MVLMYKNHRFPFHMALHVVLLAVVFGTMYIVFQQQGRIQANDMPELLATQAAKQLDAGLGLQSIQMGATDLANKPVPFVVVYDKQGKAVAGSGYLNGQLAVMPAGVINHATSGQPHAVTWAPRRGIRIASVTVAAKEYYVVGAQSLARTEARSTRLLQLIIVGYALSLLVLVGAWFTRRLHSRYALTYHDGTPWTQQHCSLDAPVCCNQTDKTCTCSPGCTCGHAVSEAGSSRAKPAPAVAQENTAAVSKTPTVSVAPKARRTAGKSKISVKK